MTEEISEKKENENLVSKEIEKEILPKNKTAKEGSLMPLFLVMIFTLVIGGLWQKVPAIKSAVDSVLNPTAGALLNWNLTLGMMIIVFVITIITTVVQKYATDQKTLKELKREQKEIQKQMKEFRSHPEKYMELQKKQMALMPKQLKLGMRGIIYTFIPFVLFFRWFYDFFAILGNPKFFGFLGWFWFYLIFAMIFSSILRKWWDVV